MSPKTPRLIHAGLTALGLVWLAPRGVADPAPPAPSGPPATAAPSPSPSTAPTPAPAVILLTNGRLQQGLVSEAGPSYYLHVRGGSKIPIPKRDVETVGRSLDDIYQYKVGRIADRDPDEHLKLAKWCLTQQLNEPAKVQLRA